MTIKTKFCTKCKVEKSRLEFSKRAASPDGRQAYCKSCKTESHREYCQTPVGRESNRKSSEKCSRTPTRKKSYKKSNKKFKELHPERVKAVAAVNNSIRSGKLHRPPYCESCGKEVFVIGHHKSYDDEDKWLDVDWFCKKCHVELHRLLRLLPEITHGRLLRLMRQRLPGGTDNVK